MTQTAALGLCFAYGWLLVEQFCFLCGSGHAAEASSLAQQTTRRWLLAASPTRIGTGRRRTGLHPNCRQFLKLQQRSHFCQRLSTNIVGASCVL
jgi:hypothetical protein